MESPDRTLTRTVLPRCSTRPLPTGTSSRSAHHRRAADAEPASRLAILPYTWLSATARPGAVPGAWLKVADCVVFQSPVHPGGGTSELDGAAITAAGAHLLPLLPPLPLVAQDQAPRLLLLPGCARFGALVSLLTYRSGNRRRCNAAADLGKDIPMMRHRRGSAYPGKDWFCG